MTIKEAIFRSLEDFGKPVNYKEIYEHITLNNYCNFKGETPTATISAQLGDFIRLGDTRVKRFKEKGGTFYYYLSKHGKKLDLDNYVVSQQKITEPQKIQSYKERDLHKLLSSYLKNQQIFSKTIFHEKSRKNDEHQKWIHPDLVGIEFLNLQTKTTQNLLKTINRADTFKISSYEVKMEINTDYELKKTFFQAVSNSSWANYGYLVAFDFNSILYDEMERLSHAFGIGIIELKANPFESRVLFPASYKGLEYKTIDKLCNINRDFNDFIEQVEKLLSASERYFKSTESEFVRFCDEFLENDSDIQKYCKDKNIPLDNEL
ncbi:MAG: hypothetical protein KAH48_01185 [Chlorobi bacterium]|nr:hypothetical protein [Chlorobiota bacterium]